MSDVLWISLILITVVVLTTYRPVISGMLFDPNYTKKP